MHGRWLALAAFALALGTGAVSEVSTRHAAAEAPVSYVDVQLDTGVNIESLNADGSSPTLAQQGFQHLPVPEGMTAEEYVNQLRQSPNVLSADRSSTVVAAAIPNDPFYDYAGPDQAAYLEQIFAPQAWDLMTGSSQTIVAVLDSGIDLAHPDLAGRIWENQVDNQSDGIDRDKNGYVNDRYGYRFVNLTQDNNNCGYSSSLGNEVQDDMGTPGDALAHGTVMAGIIGAAGNNGQGVVGINWNVRLMAVKVLDCNRRGSMMNIAQGIEYAVKNGARVINISAASEHTTILATEAAALRAAIQMAQNAGVIVVAAAGNDARTVEVGTRYPAALEDFPNLVAVGASNNLNNNIWASYSDYGPAVDFAAPGSQIVSTTRSDLGLSTPYVSSGPDGGTSYSTALTSGMFALMISRNSRLSAPEYIQIAKAAATPALPAPHGQNWAGAGIINIGGAVARVPMSVEGTPLRDWRDVPAGTTVEGVIDGNVCGSTTSQAFGFNARFSLRIKSDAEQANCGQPGKTVQIFVGGAPAVPTFPWGPPNTDLALRDKEVSSVSPPPGVLVVQALNGSWANIAHLEPTGQLPGAVSGLPTPWTSIFKWDPDKATLGALGAYLRFFRGAPSFSADITSIQQYDAYWVDAPPPNIASLNPNPPPGRTIELKQGWNNFTYTGTSHSVKDALSSVDGKWTQVLQYDNASGQWLSHLPVTPTHPRILNDFGGLFTLKVYWVLMTEDGTLVMN
ncbi:MAG: S8 family serine peptidase [Dehalococcoidia bacterium]